MGRAARPIAAALLVAAAVAAIAWQFGRAGQLGGPSRVDHGDSEAQPLRDPPLSPTATDRGAAAATPSEPPAVAAARELLVGAPIAVTTVDASERPIANVAVRLAPSLAGFLDEVAALASFTTDDSGRASLARDVLGERRGFWLLASHAGFVPTCLCLESKPLLEAGELSVVLEERVDLVVEVVDPRGKPVAGADVQMIGRRGLDALEQLGARVDLVEGSLFARGVTGADGTVVLPMAVEPKGFLLVAAPSLLPERASITPEDRASRRSVVQMSEVVVAGWRIVDTSTGRTSCRSRGSCSTRCRLPAGTIDSLAIGDVYPTTAAVESTVRQRLADADVELLVMRRLREEPESAALVIKITPDSSTAQATFPLRFVPVDEFADDDVLVVRSECRDDDLAALEVSFTDPAGRPTSPPVTWTLGGPDFQLEPPAPRDGRFEFVLPPGGYELRVYPDVVTSGRIDRRSIPLNPGTRQEIVVAVEPRPPVASVRAKALDPTGQPLKRWMAMASYRSAIVHGSESDTDPFVRVLDRLPIGRVTLQAFSDLGLSPKLDLDLVTGETREVEFTFR